MYSLYILLICKLYYAKVYIILYYANMYIRCIIYYANMYIIHISYYIGNITDKYFIYV